MRSSRAQGEKHGAQDGKFGARYEYLDHPELVEGLYCSSKKFER